MGGRAGQGHRRREAAPRLGNPAGIAPAIDAGDARGCARGARRGARPRWPPPRHDRSRRPRSCLALRLRLPDRRRRRRSYRRGHGRRPPSRRRRRPRHADPPRRHPARHRRRDRAAPRRLPPGTVLHDRAVARRIGLERGPRVAARCGAVALWRQQLLPASCRRRGPRHLADRAQSAGHRVGYRQPRRSPAFCPPRIAHTGGPVARAEQAGPRRRHRAAGGLADNNTVAARCPRQRDSFFRSAAATPAARRDSLVTIAVPLARAAAGLRLSAEECLALAECGDLDALMPVAASLRDRGHGNLVSYSKKVFIPLTQLCRDVCHYCTFAHPPRRGEAAYLDREQVLAIAQAGAKAGCKEALFTLGDKPELRYGTAREALQRLGHATTLSYLAEMAALVLEETGLLPHLNPGVMSRAAIERLRAVSVSQGIMLESASERLMRRGGPHFGSPDKHPQHRLDCIAAAGELAVPFTSGILIGIGETRRERIEALLALR